MTFHWPKLRRDRDEIARLRDELIVAQTCNVFAAEMLSSLRRRRELRKDSASYQQAKRAKTAQLQAEVGR